MFILLNGAFGIGKTTTAKALAASLPAARIYDPEPLGVVMQRLSAVLPTGRIDDFQDIALWRRLTAVAAKALHRHSATVIIPMAFSNLAYFEALASALTASGPVRKLCLVAPLPIVVDRLARRAALARQTPNAWTRRRAEACSRAHVSPAFGEPIDATGPTATIVREIVARIS